jgi:PPK2 family polyphosphate:nucleotide phosphotransferase
MKRYRIKPGQKVDLKDFDPSDSSGFKGGKETAYSELLKLTKELITLQELLYAEHRHKVLIVLQAMDTGGKDGTIRHVFEGVNPQGVRVASFKEPTPIEKDHDYLWRVHQQMPENGEIVIFNRSHYEDVLIVRVHDLVASDIWEQRYEQINAFEKMLSDEGTTILKFFLNISPDEQKKRLLDRLKDKTKQWKFNPGDLNERKLWKKYMQAYEDVLSRTSTHRAPWYIVPANRKWYRDWVITTTIIDALKGLDMKYPKPDFDVKATMEDFDNLAGDL